MRGALLGARQFHPVLPADGPAAHHRMRHFGVKLDRVGVIALPERLHREGIALGQQRGTARQIEALAMPLIDMIRPDLADLAALERRPDRVIADLDMALAVEIHPSAKMPRQHLAAEADPEIRLVFLQRHADPVDLAFDEIEIVIGALRSAEDHRAGMLLERFRQRIA
jgi:hypothetical protein